MKISLWFPAVVFYVVSVSDSNSVNVGTVLFTTTDLVKKCWTESDKSLLKARFIMQDVLPDPDCIDFSNPDAVAILIEYFHACYHIIRKSTYGKIQNVMYLALSDALGGYLRAYVLPFTRRAYYAGQVSYLEAKKLFQLYDDIRIFLKTDGAGWMQPQKLCLRSFHVRPLVITGGAKEACKELYFIEKEGKLHSVDPHTVSPEGDKPSKDQKESLREGFETFAKTARRTYNSTSTAKQRQTLRKSRKGKRFTGSSFKQYIRAGSDGGRKFFKNLAEAISKNRTREAFEEAEKMETRKWRRQDAQNSGSSANPGNSDTLDSTESATSPSGTVKRVVVPLPVLDDCNTPHSIAVPFMKQPFRNLKTGCSAFVLEYYYLAVVKCFIAKGNTRSDIKNFNVQFHSWLMSQVMPHLNEEEWYPGFGGVLRILQTIKKFGMEDHVHDQALHDIGFMFGDGSTFNVMDGEDQKGKNKVRDVSDLDGGGYLNSKRHLITAIIIVSMIWLFIFCACAFYCQATRGRRMLYEGYSRSRCQVRCPSRCTSRCQSRCQQRCQPRCQSPCQSRCPSRCPSRTRCTQQKTGRGLNFQFLIKFFKRNTECKKPCENNEVVLRLGKKRKPLACCPRAQLKQLPKRRKSCIVKDRPRQRKTGEGDCFTNYFGSLLSTAFPAQTYFKSLDKTFNQKTDERPGEDAKFRNQGQGDQVQMLWKKPSIIFGKSASSGEGREGKTRKKKRYESTISGARTEDVLGRTTSNTCSVCLEGGTKDFSTGKRSSTCDCTDSCQFQHTTTTTSSTRSQVAEKLSSATMEFFEEVISKHRARKSSTQDSTADSETECSSTSETDY